MFKLLVPIQKSAKKNGVLVIEGIASSPTIDTHSERFAPSAIEKMRDAVEKGNIPIRVEHADLVFTEIGVWKSANILEGDRLYVKGEIDTNLSLGSDIEVLLNKGFNLCLSVGGRVVDASYEMVAELGKSIRTFKDIILDEISVVKYPANPDAQMSMAKSVNWNKVEKEGVFNNSFSEDAEKLLLAKSSAHKTFVTPQMFSTMKWMESDGAESPEMLIARAKKEKETSSYKETHFNKERVWSDWTKSSLTKINDAIEKGCCCLEVDCICGKVEEDDSESGLSPMDLSTISILMKVLAQVDLPKDSEYPVILDDMDYWMNLTEEMQVVLDDRRMCCPHHNLDYSVNQELVLWQLKKLVDSQSYFDPEDYSVILAHLYRHLKELELVKSSSANITNLKSSMEPVETIQKAEATVETVTPEVTTPEVPETPVEVTPEVTPETPVEVTAPEAVAATPTVETVTPEVTPPTAEQPTAEEIAKGNMAFITKSELDGFTKSLGQMAKIVEALSASVGKVDTLEKSIQSLTVEVIGPMVKALDAVQKSSMGRKSYAASFQEVEKAMSNSQHVEADIAKAAQDDGKDFATAYKEVLNARNAA